MKAAALAFAACALHAQGSWRAERIQRAFAGCDFLLLVQEGGRIQRWGSLSASERLLPCSTFKLPHALLALESGAILLGQDRLACDPAQCHHPHGTLGLEEAIRESCVSYFMQVARRLGPAAERDGMKALGYPATGALEPPDLFWLKGAAFGVTAREQLDWIHRFYTEDLGVKPAHLAAVRAATRRTETPRWALWGKTGSSQLIHGRAHGWFTGRVAWKDGRASDVVVLLKAGEARFLGLEAQSRLERALAE